IDYLQLVQAPGRKNDNRQQEVSEISRRLKELARNLSVPVIALSQLNRRSEEKSREGNRPQLSDLRESGSLEQDADIVALIHREEFYKREDPSLKGQAKLILAKQRNGPTGEIDLIFLSESTRFADPAPKSLEKTGEAAFI
ncbi:MAG: DnaB-like helicase C-terminal domain-containing protein, partial [Elusimicrobia bacterium]|nr:DnaB-like helicase C-terminal domain-containing protein [Elusimicrobiota bacterium]